MGYMLLLIVVLAYAAWRGWRTGLLHQVAGVLAIGFGLVMARVFCEPVSLWISEHHPSLTQGFAADYKLHILSTAIVFGIVYLAFSLLATVLRSVMRSLHVGALNSMAGAAFSVLKWVVVMSVLFNVWLAIYPRSQLADYCDDGDGNLVELVMSAAPSLLGVEGPEDLWHRRQLEEAKSISKTGNIKPPAGVNIVGRQINWLNKA